MFWLTLFFRTRWTRRYSLIFILTFGPLTNICSQYLQWKWEESNESKLNKVRHFNLLCEIVVSVFGCSINVNVCLKGSGGVNYIKPAEHRTPYSSKISSERLHQYAQWSSTAGNFLLLKIVYVFRKIDNKMQSIFESWF